MNLAILATGTVGFRVVEFVRRNYPQDLALVVTLEDDPVFASVPSGTFHAVSFQSQDALQSQLRDKAIDLAIMAWWPIILPMETLAVPSRGIVNMHPSMLPFGRGRNYNFWAILDESPFGVSIHYADSGIDSGGIIAQREIPCDWTDTGATLYARAQEALGDLFEQTYPKLRSYGAAAIPQDLGSGTFHYGGEMEAMSNIHLDDTYTARQLLNLLRARTFPGHPACHFQDDGVRYEVTVEIRRLEEPTAETPSRDG